MAKKNKAAKNTSKSESSESAAPKKTKKKTHDWRTEECVWYVLSKNGMWEKMPLKKAPLKKLSPITVARFIVDWENPKVSWHDLHSNYYKQGLSRSKIATLRKMIEKGETALEGADGKPYKKKLRTDRRKPRENSKDKKIQTTAQGILKKAALL